LFIVYEMAEFDIPLNLSDLQIGDILYEPSAIDKDDWQKIYTLALIRSVKSVTRPTIPQIIIDYVKYSGTEEGIPQFYVPNENETNIMIDGEKLKELLKKNKLLYRINNYKIVTNTNQSCREGLSCRTENHEKYIGTLNPTVLKEGGKKKHTTYKYRATNKNRRKKTTTYNVRQPTKQSTKKNRKKKSTK